MEKIKIMNRDELREMVSGLVEGWTGLEVEAPFNSIEDLSSEILQKIGALSSSEKKDLLRKFPELGGGKDLTENSKMEHSAAGIDKLESNQRRELAQLNKSYRERFQFPFLICARRNDFSTIIDSLKTRLRNKDDQELDIAIEEVKKIVSLRLKDMTC